MKNKTLLLFFILGGLLVIAGAFMKIMHYEHGNYVLGTGLVFELAAFGLVLGKLIKRKETNL